jgi:hypothetical protein
MPDKVLTISMKPDGLKFRLRQILNYQHEARRAEDQVRQILNFWYEARRAEFQAR